MRPECLTAVANVLGRAMTAAEGKGIEDRVRAAMREVARRDPAAFQALSVQSRLREGAKLAAEQIRKEAADARRLATRQAGIHESNAHYMDTWIKAGGDAQDAVDRMLLDNADGKSRTQSLESVARAVFHDYARRLTSTLEAAQPSFFGMVANRDGARAIVRALYGDASDATATGVAKEWTGVVDAMVAHFRDAGGILNRLADWRMPQHHDQVAVFEAGADAWTAKVMPMLDRARYLGDDGRVMGDAEVEAIVRTAWESIASGGDADRVPGERAGKKAVSKRYTDHRVLHFKDADSFLAYQEEFGSPDLWAVMTGHVHRMSRDIGLLETFGPNPEAEFRYWNDFARSHESTKKTTARAVSDNLDKSYSYLSGQTDGIHNAFVAAMMDRTRNLLSAAKLGTAVISSIPDLATMQVTASYNRVSGLEAFGNMLRLLNPAESEGRAELQRAGLMIESTLTSISRMQGDTLGPTYTTRLADMTMRLQGLSAWTDAGRGGFGASQMHTLGRITRGVAKLDELHPEDAKLLRAKGVTDTDLAVWAAAGPEVTKFGDLLTPDAIYRIPDATIAALPQADAGITRGPLEVKRQAVQKLLGMVLSESHMAITEPGARERMQTSGGGPRGEVKSELWRSFWQFKSFPWAVVQKHLVQRGWGGHDTAGGKAWYIGKLTVLSTLTGALAMEVKDMLLGKDPRPLVGADGKVLARNWATAFLQGGALGIYGDFLASENEPMGKSALEVLAGPTGGLVHDAFGLTVGNAIQKFGGKDTNAGVEATRFVKGITPMGSLWYTKAATDHLIFNQVMDEMNPDYLRRVRDRAQREFGTRYWWAPQDEMPARAPDLSAIGGRQ